MEDTNLGDLLAAHAADAAAASSEVRVCGHLTARRKHGPFLTFLDLVSGEHSIQIVVKGRPDEASADGGAPPEAPSATAPLGSLVRVTGTLGLSTRGCVSLFVAPAALEVLEAPEQPVAPAPPAGPTARSPARFHVVPDTVRWQRRGMQQLGIGAYNVLGWRGGHPLPAAPPTPGGCWLLPSTDGAALAIARQRAELAAAGWRLLTCGAALVARLGDKAALREHAARLGLERHLPQHYGSPDAAAYPCVLKAAQGQFGRGTHIVASAEEARRRMGQRDDQIGSRWVLQELVRGRVEVSTSLLVVRGAVLRAAVVAYTYDADEYVWPKVRELKQLRRTSDVLEPDVLAALSALLAG